jgi:hypothetical protein
MMNKQQNGGLQGNEKKQHSMRNGSAMSPDAGSFNDEDFMNEEDDELDEEHEQQDDEFEAEETNDSTSLQCELKKELNESSDAVIVKCESLNRSAHQPQAQQYVSQQTSEMKMSESSSSSSSSSCSNQTDLDEENNSSIFLTPSSLSVTTSSTTTTMNTTSNESTPLIASKIENESDSASKQMPTQQPHFSISSSTSAISPSYNALQPNQTALFYSNQPNVNTYQSNNSNFNSFSDRNPMTNYNPYLNQPIVSTSTTSTGTNYANSNPSQFNLYNLNMIQPLSCSSPSSSKLSTSLPYGYMNNTQNSNQEPAYSTYNSQPSFNYNMSNYAYQFNSHPQSISTAPTSASIYTHAHHQMNTPASYLPSATIQHSIWNNSN